MLLHVRIGDLELPVWIGIVNELTVDIPVGTYCIDRHVRRIFVSVRRITLRNSKPVYIGALGRENDEPINAIVSNDVCFFTENSRRRDICIARETVITPRSESTVLIVSTMTGLLLILSKLLA